MAAPEGNMPAWATDETYSSGDDVGEDTRLEPTTGEKEQGFHRGKRPPARKLNWLLGKLSDWVTHLHESRVVAASARYEANGSGLSTAAEFTLTELYADDGFVLSDNEIEVPTPGRYIVQVVGRLTGSSTDNPLTLRISAANLGLVGLPGTVTASGSRYTATTSHQVDVSATSTIDITDPPNQKFVVRAFTSDGTVTAVDDTCTVAFVRVSAPVIS